MSIQQVSSQQIPFESNSGGDQEQIEPRDSDTR